ncbi:MAG: biotin--[acetyl-CoA-carboxylase] ligase [Chloroflexi bacterium]|nr:biotin--[acetyl-CoA-carboxylase] ligase [Chloroflexota bacterium]
MTQTDLDLQFLRQSLSGRVVGCQVLHYDLIGSTMDEARRLADEGCPEGAVVIAEEQTAGRGRFNRAWISPRGQNLSLSVLLRPKAAQLPYMNMAATLAVARTLSDAANLSPTIKWPNDVRVSGRKASGILIETAMEAGEVRHAIVGIGVNVNFDPSQYDEIASLATSIFRETGNRSDRTRVLKTLLEHFDELYGEVRAGRSLTEDWAAILDTLGKTVELRWQEQVVQGRAESVDDQGNLLIRRGDGSLFTAIAGEVTSQV